jgi:enolase
MTQDISLKPLDFIVSQRSYDANDPSIAGLAQCLGVGATAIGLRRNEWLYGTDRAVDRTRSQV